MDAKNGAEESEWGEEGNKENPSPINYAGDNGEQKNYDCHLKWKRQHF